jgi:DNA-binding GntR family transcriptional regulator
VAVTDSQQFDPRAYVQLAIMLRRQIADRSLVPGKPVPSITTLSREHGVSRPTVRKALRMLEGEGLVHRILGLAYYVRPDPPDSCI